MHRAEKYETSTSELLEAADRGTMAQQSLRSSELTEREGKSPIVRSKMVQVALAILLIGLGFLLVLIAMLLHPPFK